MLACVHLPFGTGVAKGSHNCHLLSPATRPRTLPPFVDENRGAPQGGVLTTDWIGGVGLLHGGHCASRFCSFKLIVVCRFDQI